MAGALRSGSRQGPAAGALPHADGPTQKLSKAALALAKNKVILKISFEIYSGNLR